MPGDVQKPATEFGKMDGARRPLPPVVLVKSNGRFRMWARVELILIMKNNVTLAP